MEKTILAYGNKGIIVKINSTIFTERVVRGNLSIIRWQSKQHQTRTTAALSREDPSYCSLEGYRRSFPSTNRTIHSSRPLHMTTSLIRLHFIPYPPIRHRRPSYPVPLILTPTLTLNLALNHISSYLQPIFLHQPPVTLLKSLAHVHQLYARLNEALRVPPHLPVRYR